MNANPVRPLIGLGDKSALLQSDSEPERDDSPPAKRQPDDLVLFGLFEYHVLIPPW